MADHGKVEYATAQGNDLPAHENGYERFVHLTTVGTAHVLSIVIGLAIGGVNGHWLTMLTVIIVASIVAIHGLMSGARTPSYVMVAISLLVLAVTA